jgi:hypothetical protein
MWIINSVGTLQSVTKYVRGKFLSNFWLNLEFPVLKYTMYMYMYSDLVNNLWLYTNESPAYSWRFLTL